MDIFSRKIHSRYITGHDNSDLFLNQIFNDYLDEFTLDLIGLYQYEGIETINSEMGYTMNSVLIERALFYNGLAVFTKHPIVSNMYIIVPCSVYGRNFMGEYRKFKYTLYSDDATSTTHTGTIDIDGVVIWNNIIGRPTRDMLEIYCYQLAEIDLTKKLNRDAMKTPIAMSVDKWNEQSAKIAFDQYKSFKSALFIDNTKKRKGLNPDEKLNPFEVIDLGVTSYLSDLTTEQHHIENKLYKKFGIQNGYQDKKERMVVDEVNIQEEQTDISESISHDMRKIAVDKINKLYGLSLTLKRKGEDNEKRTTDTNSEIHNNPKGSE